MPALLTSRKVRGSGSAIASTYLLDSSFKQDKKRDVKKRFGNSKLFSTKSPSIFRDFAKLVAAELAPLILAVSSRT